MNTDIQKQLDSLRTPLTPDEVEVRVANAWNGGAMLLLYKTARTDKARLNNSGLIWRNHYKYDAKGLLVCVIEYYDTRIGEWVSREDVGVESFSEKEKGSYSDAFKRAGFNYGIGSELYNFPTIIINYPTKTNKKGNIILDMPFGSTIKVEKISSENGIGTELELSIDGDIIYRWDKENGITINGINNNNSYSQNNNNSYSVQEARVKNMMTHCEKNNIDFNNVCQRANYRTGDFNKPSVDKLSKALNAIIKELKNANN